MVVFLQHYARVVLPVWMSEVSGSADDLGPAKYCVPAVTYIAQDDWTMKGESRRQGTLCLNNLFKTSSTQYLWGQAKINPL